MASHNKTLGRFTLENIPPAPRGVPQVEVTFDIDANGILNVTAKDKATGKEQSVQITASTNLDDSEVERMVQEAKQNEAADAKFKELVADEGFRALLMRAKADPKGKDARDVIGRVVGFVNLVTAGVPWSGRERAGVNRPVLRVW